MALGKGRLAVVGNDLEELKENARFVVLRNEGAASLAAYHQVFCRKCVESLAHGALAYSDLGSEFHLAGQSLPRQPLSFDKALHEHVPDLLIQRPETQLLPVANFVVCICCHR